jgi:hypothetical protein
MFFAFYQASGAIVPTLARGQMAFFNRQTRLAT